MSPPTHTTQVEVHDADLSLSSANGGIDFAGAVMSPQMARRPSDASDGSVSNGPRFKNAVKAPIPLDDTEPFPDEPKRLLMYNEFVFANQMICGDDNFNGLVVACIIIAGILVGVQSYPSMDGNPILSLFDAAVQYIFTAECIFKIFAEGRRPLTFWTGPEASWNNFDFWLVAICWLPPEAIPIGNVAFLRLLRLMRLLKLVGKVKQLQVIVMGLVKGLSSVSYIMVLMLLIFYLFAVMGVGSFRENDPFHFGSLGVAMITLFRCATLEDWTDVMYINIFGCDSQYGGVHGAYYGRDGEVPYPPYPGGLGEGNKKIQTPMGEFPTNECWSPVRQPMFSAIYFIFFELIAAFVIMSLFIGAVCGGMCE